MTIRDAIKKAVAEKDAAAVGRIVDRLRERGLNYDDTYQMVNRLTGIELADWESLLYEADTAG